MCSFAALACAIYLSAMPTIVLAAAAQQFCGRAHFLPQHSSSGGCWGGSHSWSRVPNEYEQVGVLLSAAVASSAVCVVRRWLLSHKGRQLVAPSGHGEEVSQMVVAWQPDEILTLLGVRLEEPGVFRGWMQRPAASESSALCAAVPLTGEGRFAVDVTALDEGQVLAAVNKPKPPGAPHATFVETRPLMVHTSHSTLADCGRARALLSWHASHRFCGKCGAPSKSVASGAKRVCSSDSCGARLYPYTDPVAIALVVHPSSDCILLGRSGHLKPNMYTCLSGFVEPNEPVEEAVRREVREEAGVEVREVRLLQSQPWPTGRSGSCELMLGCLAKAVSKDIAVDTAEMEDVRWFTRDEAAAALEASRWASVGRQPPDPETIYVPGSYALAHHLIRHWLGM